MNFALILLLTFAAGCSGSVDKRSNDTNPEFQFYGGEKKSTEREMVEAGMAKATNEGKILMIYVSAAWCGPCNSFQKSLEADKDLTALLEERAVVVEVDDLFLIYSSIPDFSFSGIYMYPHFQVYNPKTRESMTIDYIDVFSEAKPILEAVLKAEPQFAADMRANLRQHFADKKDFNDPASAGYYTITGLSHLLKLTIEQDPIEEFLKLYEDIQTYKYENPELFKQAMNFGLTSTYYAIESNKLTLKEVLQSHKGLVYGDIEKPRTGEMRTLVGVEVARINRSKPTNPLYQNCIDIAQSHFADDINSEKIDIVRLEYTCAIPDLITENFAPAASNVLIEKMRADLDLAYSRYDNQSLANVLLLSGDLPAAANAMANTAKLLDTNLEKSIEEKLNDSDTTKQAQAKNSIEVRAKIEKVYSFYVSEVRAGNKNPAAKYYQEIAE